MGSWEAQVTLDCLMLGQGCCWGWQGQKGVLVGDGHLDSDDFQVWWSLLDQIESRVGRADKGQGSEV